MKFIFDENLSPGLAHGLAEFGEDAAHVLDFFPPGTPDEDILKFVGENGYFLVTKDIRIRFNPGEIRALRENFVGSFFLMGKDMGRWSTVKQVVRGWEQILDKAERIRKPFIFKVNRHGTKLERFTIE